MLNSSTVNNSELSNDEQKLKNIKRLIQQNKKLHSEIFGLEETINAVINSPSAKPEGIGMNIQKQPSQESALTQFRSLASQINGQKSTIIQLKKVLEHLKSTNVKKNVEYILQEEDQLKIIKKTLYKLRKQKKVKVEYIKDKKAKAGSENNFLQGFRATQRQELKSTIKKNRQMSSNIVEIEREIRKFHNIIETYRALSRTENSSEQNKNPEYLLAQYQSEAVALNKEIHSIQQKWKGKLDLLDKQYSFLKSSQTEKQAELKSLEENLQFYRTRASALREDSQVKADKQRLSKVQVSPILKEELRDYLEREQVSLLRHQKYLRRHSPPDWDKTLRDLIKSDFDRSPSARR